MRPLLTLTLTCLLASGPLYADPARDLAAKDQALSWDGLVDRAKQARVVYVGEEHGDVSHHRLQRDLLEAMAQAGPVVLGCEYFPRSLQPVLDRFNAGEISLADFPQAVSWQRTWGHAWEAYEPLFRLCRDKKIPVVALNAEKQTAKQVRKQGLGALPLRELAALPPLDLANPAHRERVLKQLQLVHPLPKKTLERYYQAFTLWDSVMADTVCDVFLRDRRPQLRMLVVAGRAHVEGSTGIPDRVTHRLPLARLTVLCDSKGNASAKLADVVYSSRRVIRPRSKEQGWF
jgi:uncharacterized iron-regulated protein